MIVRRIAVAAALLWPVAVVAVEPGTGSETDDRKVAAAASWKQGGEAHRPAQGEPEHRRAAPRAAADQDRVRDRLYRYGGREPVLEELTGHGAAVASTEP